MLLAKLASAGLHDSKACVSPPTITSSSPASAAGSPRVSGMSRSTIPLSARRAASRAMVLGATVDATPTISPRRPAPAMPSRPRRTASACVEADHDDDKIAAFRDRPGIVRHSDAALLRLPACVRVDVVSGHFELGPREMTGHRMAHLAKPDNTHATNGARAHVPTFLLIHWLTAL